MSEPQGTAKDGWYVPNDRPGEHWFLPEHRPGQDPAWDRLGEDWRAIDGVLPVRIYVRWDTDDGRWQIAGLCIADGPVTANMLRAIPFGRLENLLGAPRDLATNLPPLIREKGTDPVEFSQRVARYYRVFSVITDKPAKKIAEHSGVPVGTVRSWIHEARLRGNLPPGRKGKAG